MKNSSDIFADFGYCHSPYDEIVRPFYNFWSYFSTQKTFKWKDCYDSKLAKNRSEFRAIEKENKVFRDEAKKTYNKELRSLVLFIKKRDPRIKDIGQEFPPLNKIKPDFDWNKHYENYHQDMDAIESLIDDEFCEKIESFHIEQFDEKEFKNGVAITESGTSATIYIDRIICLLCDLCFETIKSFRNHTKSRTHRELYQTFVQTLNANQDKIDSNSVEIYESNPKKIIEAQQYNTTTKISQPLNGFNSTQNDSNPLMCKACGTELSSRNKLFEHIRETQHAVFKKDAKKKIKNTRKKK
ncbi:hypothetical protein HZS_5870 [Henneguya salminicola]|nr:hypothetical protein HZS_5870 [Henneguya salminicola]